ncbi:PIWL2 protein, partial [Polyodon spathula]|nr:PIWL2 protein [Polyodon spathula]
MFFLICSVLSSPNVECRSMRFGVMKEHRSVTGEVTAFDGSILYLSIRLEEVCKACRAHAGCTGSPLDFSMQKSFCHENDFFDGDTQGRSVIQLYEAKSVSSIGCSLLVSLQCARWLLGYCLCLRLQVWPGYSSCVKRTDGGLFLTVDVSHKVLQKDSVLDVISLFVDLTVSLLVFQECYLPAVVFHLKADKLKNVTFRNPACYCYGFCKNYGITIKDLDQPLLVHRPKERSRPGEKVLTGEMLLLPELSFITGIPDKMRKDFRAMKASQLGLNWDEA